VGDDDTSRLENLHECLKVANELLPPEHHEWETDYAYSLTMFREASVRNIVGEQTTAACGAITPRQNRTG
jgi:hypothetical protein